jgi:hypothetical protein
MTVIRSKMDAICSTHGANVWFKNLKGHRQLEVGDLGGSVILKWVYKKLFGVCGLNRVWFGNGTEGIEPSGFVKTGNVFE